MYNFINFIILWFYKIWKFYVTCAIRRYLFLKKHAHHRIYSLKIQGKSVYHISSNSSRNRHLRYRHKGSTLRKLIFPAKYLNPHHCTPSHACDRTEDRRLGSSCCCASIFHLWLVFSGTESDLNQLRISKYAFGIIVLLGSVCFLVKGKFLK